MAAVTYLWPATVLVAPTALQAKERVVAQISTVTAAGAIQVVHNLALTAAQLAAGQPVVELTPLLPEYYVNRPIASAQSANGTTITVLSGSSTLTGVLVTIRRPHTIGD